jgi:ssDNA-binding Zn-finger/Zn-ribbon topoisomerase 1
LNKKELTKIVKLESKKIKQQIIFNDQPIEQEIEVCCISCPSCKEILNTFRDGLPRTAILRALVEESNNFNLAQYCPKCGQKLGMLEIIKVKNEVQSTEEQ